MRNNRSSHSSLIRSGARPAPARPAVALSVSIAAVAAAIAAAPATAQPRDPTRERVRLIQESASRRAAEDSYLRLPRPGVRGREVGAWSSLTFLNLRNDDRRDPAPDLIHALLVQDFRVWMTGELSDEVSAYARFRDLKVNFYTQPGVVEPNTRSQEGVEVDLLYVDFNPETNLHVRAGRQFVRVGRGLALALDLDGVAVDHTLPDWTYRLFVGETLRRDVNIDSSIVGFDRRTQARTFYLAEVETRRLDGKRYYGYVTVQQDRSRSLDLAQIARPFGYNSYYLGLGTEGRWDPMLAYYMEAVYQGGSSMVDLPANPRVDIDAAGIVAGLLYYPKGRSRPLATLEYGFGSGDPSRASVTNTFGGKFAVNQDGNFLYFGAYDGGLALSPRLSNIHVIRAGYQVKPRPEGEHELPQLLLGGKLSYYFKDTANGLFSDTAARLASKDVGFGIDLFTAYRPFSDSSVLLQYGLFLPGSAYAPGTDDSGSRLLLTSTLSF
jgi:hypothetical protein